MIPRQMPGIRGWMTQGLTLLAKLLCTALTILDFLHESVEHQDFTSMIVQRTLSSDNMAGVQYFNGLYTVQMKMGIRLH